MIRRLQRQFIAIALAVMVAAIVFVAVVVNVANWLYVRAEIQDTAWQILAGEEPQASGQRGSGKKRMKRESDYEARYFIARFFPDRPAVDLTHVTSYSQEQALSLAQMALESGRENGFYQEFYYQAVSPEGQCSAILMLNCETKLRAMRSLIVISGVTCASSALIAWLLVSLFSRRAIRPILENEEKQKRFITDASHELKTPLSVIGANMDVLALDLEGNEWVRSTQKQVGLMRRMINDMVFLARADETAGHPQLAAVELTRVFREAAEPFALAAEAKGQTVRLETEENILVSGDEAELARMISVLCDNAVKYAPEGSTITVRLYRDRKYAVLETENLSQQPLEPEKLRHLFDRFYRGEEAHVRDGSYGIGLAIARAIAEKHGGMAMACMQGERICISCRVLCRRERHA